MVTSNDTRRERGLAVIADPHIGPVGHSVGGVFVYKILEQRILATFYEALSYVDEHTLHRVLVIAGDLFSTRVISPRIIGELSEMLSYFWERGTRVVVLPGNHDIDMLNGSALKYLPNTVTVLDKPGVHSILYGSDLLDIAVVPFVYGRDVSDVIDDVVADINKSSRESGGHSSRLLIGHFGLYNNGDSYWMEQDTQSISVTDLVQKLKGTSIDAVVVGHYHMPRYFYADGIACYQVGTLAPRSFSDIGEAYGNVLLVDGFDEEELQITHNCNAIAGPRFIDDFYNDFSSADNEPSRRCWYISRRVLPRPIYDTKFHKRPKTLDDVICGATTVVGNPMPNAPKVSLDQEDEIVKSPEAAIRRYITTNIGTFEVPKVGLLKEALARYQKSGRTYVCSAPKSNPLCTTLLGGSLCT